MGVLLQTENVQKNFLTKKALRGVSLSLEQGRILGLMGPNGSGKTTFLKILAGLQKANAGKVLICGHEVGIETKKIVSYLPDRNTLFPWMKAIDAIDYYADFFTDFNKAKSLDMLNFLKLDKNEKVKTMSKGMQEKLNLTLAFSRQAKLFLLDEPLGGIDPVARERIVSTIIKTYSEDSSLIISTHLVNDVEAVFDDVAFISEGTILLSGSAEVLRTEHSMSIDALYIHLFADRS